MRGVFQVRAPHGYTVMVNGVTLPMQLSWSNANQLCRFIAMLTYAGDGRGFARCHHPGSRACFSAGKCLRIQSNENRDGEIPWREPAYFHYDERMADYWYTYEDDHDPGDEDVQR